MKPEEGAIYPPPRKGLPFLVVRFTADGVQATSAPTRVEARMIASRQHRAQVSRSAAGREEAVPGNTHGGSQDVS
jgi:hypothetical protein